MPVYNSETFLAEAIESILSQTLGDFELLIVYDESRDSSFAIIERHRRLDPRISVIQGQGKALIGALNQGIDAARGKYIARMDADDVSYPKRFEKQVEVMESAGADICGCHWLMINERGKLIEAKLVPLCRDTFTIFLACEVPFAHGSVMMRAEFIQRHALRYGGSLIEDYDLWIRFFEKGAKFVNVDDFLFKWRDLDYALTRKLKKVAASKNKALRRRFVRGNLDACVRAIQDLTKRYSTLSQAERVSLLLASWLVSIVSKRPALWNVVRHSSGKSIGVAVLYLVRGV